MNSLSNINNQQLLDYFSGVVIKERTLTAEVVRYIAELYKRRLYAELGFSSLFAMLTEKYLYSKSAAYRRIQAAKVFLLFPRVLEYLEAGKLNLVSLSLIEPHVTQENGEKLIQDILGKNKEEIEYYLSNHFFKVEKTQDKIRRLPVIKKESIYFHSGSNFEMPDGSTTQGILTQESVTPGSATPEVSQEEKKKVLSLSFFLPDTLKSDAPPQEEEVRRVKIEFVADEKVAQKIERAKELLRHRFPQGKLEDIINEALELLLEKKDPERKIKRINNKETVYSHSGSTSETVKDASQKKEKTSLKMSFLFSDTPIPRRTLSRYIPKTIQREVYERDHGECSYTSHEGKKCGERNFLELDHIRPFSLDGASTKDNLRLLCRAHNQWRREKTFGRWSCSPHL